MSELVNDALCLLLAENRKDISAWQERRLERPIAYEEFLKDLAHDGTI